MPPGPAVEILSRQMSFEKAHPPTSCCYSSLRCPPTIDPTPRLSVMAMATHVVLYAIAVEIFTGLSSPFHLLPFLLRLPSLPLSYSY
jgi:hypothetical protein